MSQIKGKISQIIGPVVDVSFENAEKLPNLMEAPAKKSSSVIDLT